MSLISRLLSSILLICALLASFLCLAADRLFELSTVTDLFGHRISRLEQERKSELMTRDTESSLARLGSKDRIAESLIRGELSVVDAAALYRSLYDDPRAWRHPHRPKPKHDDGETWCREVVEWTVTKVSMERSAREAEVLQRRFETELREQLVSHGMLRLTN